MPTKVDIKKILSKGLTGKEAGKLIFQDNWLADSMRGGFLSQKDMASIKAGLRTDKDIKEYNSYIRLYKYVDYTLKEARIVALEAESFLNNIYRVVETYEMVEDFNRAYMYIPAIVTQKQYEELSAKQRASQLEGVLYLDELISYFSGVELEYVLDEDEPEPVIDFQHDERLIQAVEKIKELLKAGKLHPLKLKKQADYYHSHKLKIPAQPVEEVIKILDKLLTGESQKDALTVFRVKELYDVEEVADWVRGMVEKYQPNWDEETSARPADMMQSRYVAIIQNPGPEDLDERGYWIEKDYLGTRIEKNTERDAEFINIFIQASRERIKAFLAIRSVLEAISKVIEVDFMEDLEQWRHELQSVVNVFNTQVDRMEGKWERLELPELKPIKLGQIKATTASIRYFRERMALALGDNWWEAPKDNLKLEADEPDTLAQELTEELEGALKKELQKRGE